MQLTTDEIKVLPKFRINSGHCLQQATGTLVPMRLTANEIKVLPKFRINSGHCLQLATGTQLHQS